MRHYARRVSRVAAARASTIPYVDGDVIINMNYRSDRARQITPVHRGRFP